MNKGLFVIFTSSPTQSSREGAAAYGERITLNDQSLLIGRVAAVEASRHFSEEEKRRRRQDNEKQQRSAFGTLFNEECVKVNRTRDIAVRTNGYAGNGRPVQTLIRMHDYTF